MSRLAKKPISIPKEVTIKKEGRAVFFKGSRGELKRIFPAAVNIEISDGAVEIRLQKGAARKDYPLLGTAVAILKNCLKGVADGFEKKLEIEGIGYKVQMEGKDLVFSLGFTHLVKIAAPEGINFKVEKNTILVSGVDKELVGQVAASIRSKKPPEPYKGKGIHYAGEVIRRKAGKKAVAAS